MKMKHALLNFFHNKNPFKKRDASAPERRGCTLWPCEADFKGTFSNILHRVPSINDLFPESTDCLNICIGHTE
jgi:hypothetical protein